MAEVRFEAATRIYPGTEVPAVNKLNLDIADGELLVLVGPSGSGKSTALRMLAGLEHVNEGAIYINDVDVTLLPPQDRDIAMVFQNYALYPSMTVAENMGFALKQQKVPKDERRSRVEEAARILDLTEYLDRKPKNLSGGQRQRVAMGRAIVRSPQVFLMDDLQARLAVTTVYVTHDQVEAMTMGDRVAVLDHGHLKQVDRPRDLYAKPANRFVAGFIGSPAMNLIDITRDGTTIAIGDFDVPLTEEWQHELGTRSDPSITIGVRPEHLSLNAADAAEGIRGEVVVVEELGSESFVHIRMDHEGTEKTLVVRDVGETNTQRGENVRVTINGPTHMFGHDGDRIG